jgi:putative colanic acid biosynthesis UDP-glucose lipid carrier transferase
MDTITKERREKRNFNIMQDPVLPIYVTNIYKEEGKVKTYMFFKRIFDVLISSVLILTVLSWLYPILAILIRISSRGRTLFIQERAGLYGKTFKCFKFRTMVFSAEADTSETKVNDARITKIGRWLRLSYIDEMPQLFNVLIGDMSIIGPRPHMLYHHYKFIRQIPSYNYRHNLKPGITGLSQVKGYHGSLYDLYSIYGRTKLDMFYVNKVSLKLDIMILLKTSLIFFKIIKKSK